MPTRERNRLLAALSPLERQRLAPNAERVPLEHNQVLSDGAGRPRYVYFPEGGMLSMLGTTADGRDVELVQVGNEGVVGLSVLLRGDAALARVVVQIPSTACRIRADALYRELDRTGSLRTILLRYTYTLFRQLSQSSVCHALHSAEQRMARWLLAARDHNENDTVLVTQSRIAELLGVQRTVVSSISTMFEDKKLIHVRYGKVRIDNRRRLEALACECYQANNAEIASLGQALAQAHAHVGK